VVRIYAANSSGHGARARDLDKSMTNGQSKEKLEVMKVTKSLVKND
jgi:hypothetical protein